MEMEMEVEMGRWADGPLGMGITGECVAYARRSSEIT